MTSSSSEPVDVQKKFANAKAISSDMMFRSNEMDVSCYSTKTSIAVKETNVKSDGNVCMKNDGRQQENGKRCEKE